MKKAFEGLRVLCPLDGAPVSDDYPTRQAHLDATQRFITEYFRAQPDEETTTYRCLKCRDEGGFITKEERNDRLYEFWNKCNCVGRGAWARPNFGFPDYVQRVSLHKLKATDCVDIVKRVDGRQRVTAHIGTNPARGYQIGLAMASDIANNSKTVKVVSAKTAPTDFGEQWTAQTDTRADALFLIDVDRRLTAPQVQAIAIFIDRVDVKALIVFGEVLKNLPKTNGWASVALSLQAKGAELVTA